MANRVIFQETQTEPENLDFCRNDAQCGHGADLDSFGGDIAVGGTQKAL